MGDPVVYSETAVRLFHVLLYCTAYIFGAAAVIALGVYAALVCSEMLSPDLKTRRAKAVQPSWRVPVPERTTHLFPADDQVSIPRQLPDRQVASGTVSSFEAQLPVTAASALQSAPSGAP